MNHIFTHVALILSITVIDYDLVSNILLILSYSLAGRGKDNLLQDTCLQGTLDNGFQTHNVSSGSQQSED